MSANNEQTPTAQQLSFHQILPKIINGAKYTSDDFPQSGGYITYKNQVLCYAKHYGAAESPVNEQMANILLRLKYRELREYRPEPSAKNESAAARWTENVLSKENDKPAKTENWW